jgi:vacuolar iron transporter family protein
MTLGPHLHHGHHEHRALNGGAARAAVFGVSDGLVSNISLVLGFAGSGAASNIVRLAGIAGLVGGAFSMAAGEYVSVSAQNELVERELAVERRELHRNPQAETAELARIYESKGIERGRAQAAAVDIMRNTETALLVHAREEMGIDPDDLASPWVAAGASFAAFAVGAILPVIPWFFGSGGAATIVSIIIGLVAAVVVGTVIGRLAERSVAKSAARQILILILACGATYLIGSALGVSVS